MALKTKLTELLGIEHPVIAAPMALVSGGALARAVSEAGGLGLIGGGYCDGEWIGQAWRDAGNTKVGIGFITWALEAALKDQPSLLEDALAHEPGAIWLSFGDEGPFSAEIKAAGVPLICQIQTLEDAKRALDAGADVLVAQGTEAGGHGAKRATLPLVPAVVDIAGDVPVVAAGGIADGRGVAAALMLGASGVAMGAAFYAATEALSHPAGRARLVAADGDSTVRTSVIDVARDLPWPEQYNIRVLRNDLTEKWQGKEAALRQSSDDKAAIVDAYTKAVGEGDFDTAAVVVGEGADLIKREAPAADILHQLIKETERCLSAPPGLKL
ncbi:MAG: nitronate monooxygenase [Alphaproteobacteria bacterium]|nr:nitronate monooxygenase [Alphaproteobacteria bacterium SS10]